MSNDQETIRPNRTNLANKILSTDRSHFGSRSGISPAIAAVTAVIVTLLVVSTIVYVGFILPKQESETGQSTSTTQSQASGSLSTAAGCTSGVPYYCGQLITQTTGADHFSATTTYTTASNYATTWFINPTGSAFQSMGSASSSTPVGQLAFSLNPSAQGILYAEVAPQSGQNYYVDTALTMARNQPYVTGWTYQPVDNTNVNHFVFKINTAGIAVQSGYAPTLNFNPYFIAYSTASMVTPSNITSVGTSPVNEFVQWTTTLATVNTGAMITEAIITVNNTNPAVAQPIYLNNPTVGSSGTIPLSSMSSQQLTSSYQYSYYFTASKTTTDLSSGALVTYGQNQLNSAQWTFAYQNDFGACTSTCNGLLITLQLYVLQPNGTPIVIEHAWTASK